MFVVKGAATLQKPAAPLTVAGKLKLPTVETPGPAVLICHGSDGVDTRGEFYAGALGDAGIATLEIDMWSARGTARIVTREWLRLRRRAEESRPG